MKETINGEGFFIYKCRNCGEEFYSEKRTSIELYFEEAVNGNSMLTLYHRHDCNETQTGVGDLIAYTGAGNNIQKEESK